MSCCGRSAINTRSRIAARITPRVATAVPSTAYRDRLIYSATADGLNGRNGQFYPLSAMLISTPGRPRGNWRVSVPVKGQSVAVDGRTPRETYKAVSELLTRNGLSVPPRDIWAHCWIQWLQRTPEKYHVVALKDLMAIVTASPAGDLVVDPRKRDYPPSVWGSIAWRWLNIYLARETFNFQDFLAQCRTVLMLLDPNLTPALGCPDCWKSWAQHLDKLRQKPGMDLAAARLWLFTVHNEINAKLSKRVFTWEEAAKAAFWI